MYPDYPQLNVDHMEHAVDSQVWLKEEIRHCPVMGLVDHRVSRVSEDFRHRDAGDPFFDPEWQGKYLKGIDRVDVGVVAESESKEALAAWLHKIVSVGCARFHGESHRPIISPIDEAYPDTCTIGVSILFRVCGGKKVNLDEPLYLQ